MFEHWHGSRCWTLVPWARVQQKLSTAPSAGEEGMEQLWVKEPLGFAAPGWFRPVWPFPSPPHRSFYTLFTLAYWRQPFQYLILFLFQLSTKQSAFNESHSKQQHLTVWLFCRTVLLRFLRRDVGTAPTQLSALLSGAVLVCWSTIWRRQRRRLHGAGGELALEENTRTEPRRREGSWVPPCHPLPSPVLLWWLRGSPAAPGFTTSRKNSAQVSRSWRRTEFVLPGTQGKFARYQVNSRLLSIKPCWLLKITCVIFKHGSVFGLHL